MKTILSCAFAVGAVACCVSGIARAERMPYTDESAYLSTLGSLGYSTFSEGFEDGAAWGSVRSTLGDTQTAQSISNLGITWQSSSPNNDITTGNGAAIMGDWGFYSLPHGDYQNGIGDGWRGTGNQTLYGVGGWVSTNTPFGEIELYLDGDALTPVDFADNVVGTQPRFFGVIDTNGFTTFDYREVDGTIGDQKFIFSDDFTFGIVPEPSSLLLAVTAVLCLAAFCRRVT